MEQNDLRPLVSICMPAFNAGRYVLAAVSSIMNQSYPHWELIIVNDGSTDNTAEQLSLIADKRVQIYQQQNKGQCHAANRAFSFSKGGLIKFMDADDLISPNFIEAQVNRIGGRDDVVVSAAWGRFYNDDESTFRLSKEDVWQDLPGDEWLVQSWKRAKSMMQCGLWLIPRRVLQKSGLWDESLSLINDLDFFTRVLLSCNYVLFEGDAILYYRSGIAGSLSNNWSPLAVASAFKSMDRATKNLLQVRTDKQALLSCANTWQQLVYMLYPNHPTTVREAEKRIKYLGGSDLPFPSTPKSAFLLRLFNWRIVKRLKLLANR